MQPQRAQLLPTRPIALIFLQDVSPSESHQWVDAGQLLQWLSGYEWGQHRCCGCTWDGHLIQSWGVQEASQMRSSEMTSARDVPGAGRMIFNLQLVLNGRGKTRVFIKVRQMAAGGAGGRDQGTGGKGQGGRARPCTASAPPASRISTHSPREQGPWFLTSGRHPPISVPQGREKESTLGDSVFLL